MNASLLYHDLKARGVVLEADGDKLLVDAPAGELTNDDKSALAEFKPILLKLLLSGSEESQADGCRFDARPSRYPGYTSLYDPIHDEWHDFPTPGCYPSIIELANKKRGNEGTV